jgi:hypothetical protein
MFFLLRTRQVNGLSTRGKHVDAKFASNLVERSARSARRSDEPSVNRMARALTCYSTEVGVLSVASAAEALAMVGVWRESAKVLP